MDGPVIAALHGFASGTFTWAGVAPIWGARFRLVAWDRPPFGRSGRPDPRRDATDPYRLEREVDRAVSVIGPRAGPDGVVLVGHSAGALLAVQLVVAGALPVRAVVLIAPGLDSAPPAFVRTLAALPRVDPVATAALRIAVLGVAPALRSLSRHRSPVMEATARESGRSLRRPGTARALWHLTATWQPPQLSDVLAPLGLPTMVIGGRDDRISTPASTREVAELLDAELHLLEGVGHAPHEQRPDVVAPLVSAFVEGLGR